MADTSPTELDKALAFVQENPDEIHVFYNTFLNSVLYLPTHDTPEEDDKDESPSEKQLRPIFAQSGDTLFLMMFDSLERLSAWAEKNMGYVGLEGHAILDMMDPKFQWYLNYGSENGRVFGSKEIAWLKAAVQKSVQSPQSLEIDENVILEGPGEVPEVLLEALHGVANEHVAVREAALGTFYMPDKMNQPDLALAIRTDSMEAAQREVLLDAFTKAARSILSESDEFWIFIAGETAHADRLLAAVDPLYVRAA